MRYFKAMFFWVNKVIKEIKSLKLYKTLTNSAWLVIEKCISLVVGMATSAFVARYFGAEVFGLFNYSNSFVSIFTIVSTLGLESIVVKEILFKKYTEGEIVSSSLILRMMGGVVIILLSNITVQFFKPDSAALKKLVLILSIQMVFKAFEVFEYWTQAYQKAKYVSIVKFIGYLLSSSLKLFVVFSKRSITDYAWIFVADSAFFASLMSFVYVKYRTDKTSWRLSFPFIKHALSQSKYLIVAGLMSTIYTRIDQLMLGSMMPTTATLGVYSIAVLISNLWIFVPNSIITSFRPVVMNSFKTSDEEKYENSLIQLYGILLWMGIVCGIIISIIGQYIVLFLYGTEYVEAAKFLAILIWGTVFGILGCGVSLQLICEGNQKYNIALVFFGCIINIILNYLLIPRHGGYGAAIATFVTQLSSNFLLVFVFRKTRKCGILVVKAFNPIKLKTVFERE